jgi:hypothetical protein
MSKKIVIVYHSGYGHTQRVAEEVAAGSGGTLLRIDAEGNLPEGGWEQLEAADAIVFGSPTYMGTVSWQFKKFADASSKPGSARSGRTSSPPPSPTAPPSTATSSRRCTTCSRSRSSTACCGWARA